MDACKGADAIIGGTLMGYYAAIISEKLQIPFMTAFVNPGYVSTKAFPHFLVSQKIFPLGFLNSLTYLLVFKSYHKQKAPEFNEWRKKLGLGSPMALLSDARRKQKTLILNGFSPVLLQRPKDWDPQIEVTGIWKTDEKHKIRKDLPEGLANWIKAGTPPVYFGFGSMPVSNPEEMQKMIVEVCKEIGIRGIIHAGWSHFKMNENIPDDSIYFLNEFIDLEWLFPKCSILVHHGGVGTTHLGVESGTPTIICSIFADNPLWGEQLRRLNIGRHIRFSKLNKAKLIKAIKELQDEKIRANALKIGKKISAENGLRNAIDLIEKYLPTAPIYINNES
jgi:UDP:flavonoid glycosyltransferase YjiC (YdhE family)